MLGVDHFYLYNNNSTDDYLEVLSPFIESGIVTLKDWEMEHGQMAAYRDFYENRKGETNWVIFLDMDEFICPVEAADIREWLHGYRKYPSVLLYWKMFGTSGKTEHDYNALTIEQYTVSWPFLDKTGKSFINTRYDIREYGGFVHHHPMIKFPAGPFKIGLPPVDTEKHFKYRILMFLPFCKYPKKASCQINHYWTKAWEVYDRKRRLPSPAYGRQPKRELSYFFAHEYRNTSVDHNIFRFLIRLKMEMGIITPEQLEDD